MIQEFINAYLLCFPEKSREYAESYFSDLEQYKFITYSASKSEEEIYAFVIYRMISCSEAEIIDIGVVPDKRSQGFGAKILNEMEFKLKKQNVKKIHLEFREDNFPAEKLYRKLGYIKVGERKDYYKALKTGNSIAKNAVLMTKFI